MARREDKQGRKNAARAPGRLRRTVRAVLPSRDEWRANRESLLWAFGSVFLLRLCHPPLDFWPLAFVALVPWLWGLRRTTPRMAFWVSWLFGFLHFLTVFLWLGALVRFNPFILLGIPLLSLFKGLFYALSGAGMVYFARRMGPWQAVLLGVLWFAGWEWWRSVGALGAPFALLGHAAGTFLPLAQVTSIGGVPLLSAFVLLMNLAVMEFIAAYRLKALDVGVFARSALAVALLVVAIPWGLWVMSNTAVGLDDNPIHLKVAILQPNIPQDLKYASYADRDPVRRRELQDQFTLELLSMMDELEPGEHDLVVTPEAGFTQQLFDASPNADVQRELRERAAILEAPIVVGANDNMFLTAEGDYSENIADALVVDGYLADVQVYNGIYIVRPDDNRIKNRSDYRKVHLMPFGETVPYFDLIPGLQEKIVQIGSFGRGEKHQPPFYVDVDPTPGDPTDEKVPLHIGPTICFEDMFAYLHNRLARRGVQVFVNFTNNAWFDPSLGSRFHFAYARYRAPETRRPVVFVTNTGVTAVVDGAGRIVDELPPLEKGILKTSVRVPAEPELTLYGRFGDWFGILGFLVSWAVLLFFWWKEHQRARAITDS